MDLMLLFSLINYLLEISNGYISQGVYAVTDYRYDGFISEGAIGTFYVGSRKMISERMYNSLASVKECNMFCLFIATCRSFVIDRYNRKCYASRFDRCNSAYYTTPLLSDPTYITFDVIPGVNETRKTCFQHCLESANGNCSACGRMWCSGMGCDICKITCWDLKPLIYIDTIFWRTLNLAAYVTCSGVWQSAFSWGADRSYPEMNTLPLWLQLIVTLSNGSSYNSYFANVTLLGSSITVGKYLGGAAGNFWNAPGTFTLQNHVNDTCNSFYYKDYSQCNIKPSQIPTFQSQINQGTDYYNVIRGYMWDVCDPIIDNTIYVKNIDMQVTPLNNSMANPAGLASLRSC